MDSSAAIEVTDLKKRYQGGWIFGKGFLALKGVNLTVNRGEVFGLLGPNGAGKTTLIKILLGIIRRSEGHASLLGVPAGSKGARRKIGYLPENLNFPAHHTAWRALKLYGRLSGVPESHIRSRGQELLAMVGLAGRDSELVRKYSKGMRQRLGLAQSMLHEPELMILDEPTDGLDPVGRNEIRQIINRLKDEGKTVFLNSHILQEVELICDRVAILAGGEVKGIGTPRELTQKLQGQLSSRLRIELTGRPEHVNSLETRLNLHHQDASLVALPGERWEFTTSVETQFEIDQLVDLLRQNDVGICKLQKTQPTLEEVFLSAVQDGQ
jgi:ABC-2 type transport system ATP-binding protein